MAQIQFIGERYPLEVLETVSEVESLINAQEQFIGINEHLTIYANELTATVRTDYRYTIINKYQILRIY